MLQNNPRARDLAQQHQHSRTKTEDSLPNVRLRGSSQTGQGCREMFPRQMGQSVRFLLLKIHAGTHKAPEAKTALQWKSWEVWTSLACSVGPPHSPKPDNEGCSQWWASEATCRPKEPPPATFNNEAKSYNHMILSTANRGLRKTVSKLISEESEEVKLLCGQWQRAFPPFRQF